MRNLQEIIEEGVYPKNSEDATALLGMLARSVELYPVKKWPVGEGAITLTPQTITVADDFRDVAIAPVLPAGRAAARFLAPELKSDGYVGVLNKHLAYTIGAIVFYAVTLSNPNDEIEKTLDEDAIFPITPELKKLIVDSLSRPTERPDTRGLWRQASEVVPWLNSPEQSDSKKLVNVGRAPEVEKTEVTEQTRQEMSRRWREEKQHSIATLPPDPITPALPETKEKKKSGKGKLAAIVAATIVGTLAVGGGGVALAGSQLGWFNNNKSGVSVEDLDSGKYLPSVRGMSSADATKTIKALKNNKGESFDVEIREENSADEAKGTAIRTTPAAGTKISEIPGNKIILFVSSGKPDVNLPSMIGFPQDQAETIVKSLGLTSTVRQEDSKEKVGTVLSYTPEAGDVPAGTNVDFVVASGYNMLPKLSSGVTSASAAEQALKDAGFTVTIQEILTQDSKLNGKVAVNEEGRKYEVGTAYTLQVYKYTPPVQQPTPSVVPNYPQPTPTVTVYKTPEPVPNKEVNTKDPSGATDSSSAQSQN